MIIHFDSPKKFCIIFSNVNLNALRTAHTNNPRISCYTKLLIVERVSLSSYFKDLVSARTAPAMRSKQIVNEERSVKYPLEKKLSAAVRTARSIRSKKLVIRLNGSSFRCSKLLSPDHLSRLRRKENGNVVNSSKRCLPSPHEFSRYIFCWIALLASIAFDYCYTFYSRLKACLHGGGEPKGEVTRLSI